MIDEAPATAVVTGAASGIGRALAIELAARRHHVHVADVAPTHELAAQIGGTSHLCDVGDPQAMVDLAASATDAAVVCVNAGVVGSTVGLRGRRVRRDQACTRRRRRAGRLALDAPAAGRFLVVPDEWADAIRDRADRLARGVPPAVPSPTPFGEPDE